MHLSELRNLTKSLRSFDAEYYLKAKIFKINEFFSSNNLDSCILGISGGVDSATVLGLLLKAQKEEGSPLKRVWPILIPIYGPGMTGQDIATEFGLEQCAAFNIEPKVVDLSEAQQVYIRSCPSASAWADGQLACILRTPCFYYHAALLQAGGFKSIVVGTTDRDEGAYIGFYGKASDAMVDLQPIADAHKSEVQAVGKLVGVIPEILKRAPTGDVWNSVTSEEMIGAPFWFLEMYLLIKVHRLQNLVNTLPGDEQTEYWKYANAIEELHTKNAHKYKVGLPSHFIDCVSRGVPGGWSNGD